MSACQISAVRRWASPRWPSWPLTLKINLCNGNAVQVYSIEFLVDVNLLPRSIRVCSGSGHVISLIEYDLKADKPPETKLICNPPIEMTHLELIVLDSHTIARNPFDQVLIKNLFVYYLPTANNVLVERPVTNEIQDDFQNPAEEFGDRVLSDPVSRNLYGNDFAHLEQQCKNCIKRIKERRKKCQDLQLTLEIERLDRSLGKLSSLIIQIQACERDKILSNNFESQSEAESDHILECFQELHLEAISEISKIDSFDPTLSSDQLIYDAISDKAEVNMDPFGDLEEACCRMPLLDSDRKQAANRLYELFGSDSIDTLSSATSDFARLQALHRCFTKLRSHVSDPLFICGAERLIEMAKYDPFSQVRDVALMIAELVLADETRTAIAVHFLCDQCKRIRENAARILCNIWQESKNNQALLWHLLESTAIDSDWSVVLGWCYAIHRLIVLFDCSEQENGTRVCLAKVMPFVIRALRHQNQSVRNAAVAVCNGIEARLGSSSIEHYLSEIDPMSMLATIDKLSDMPIMETEKATAPDEPKLSSFLNSTPRSPSSDIEHFIPAAKTSEELLQLWSF